MEEFPGNSIRAKQPQKSETPEPKKVEKVVTGEVIQRKKGLGKRFMENFFTGADTKSVFEYIFMDVLIPSAKDTLADAVTQGVERKLWGEVRSTSRRSRGAGGILGKIDYQGHTPYNRYGSSSSSRRPDPRESRGPSRRARAMHNFAEIIIPTRVEGEEVIDRLFDLVSRYEMASVADLYTMLGVDSDPIDQKWGWTDLRGSGVTRVNQGYLLELPRPEPLD